MTDAPERICANDQKNGRLGWHYGTWQKGPRPADADPDWNGTEYVRADTITALRDELREARDVLAKYRDDFCEGFCEDVPAGFYTTTMDNDCSGCRARAFLTKTQPKGADT